MDAIHKLPNSCFSPESSCSLYQCRLPDMSELNPALPYKGLFGWHLVGKESRYSMEKTVVKKQIISSSCVKVTDTFNTCKEDWKRLIFEAHLIYIVRLCMMVGFHQLDLWEWPLSTSVGIFLITNWCRKVKLTVETTIHGGRYLRKMP